MSFIHISNINNSVMSFGGEVNVTYSTDSGVIADLLLQALEIEHAIKVKKSYDYQSCEIPYIL